MKKLTVSIFSVCVTIATHADVPVYQDHTLSIPKALVITEGSASYYTDIKLTTKPDGSFELAQAEQLAPTHVDEVTVAIEPSEPLEVSVTVSGYLPTPCYRLEEPAVMRKDSTFTIVLAQRPLQTFAPCVQMIEPFTLLVPLSVEGLHSGHYTVIVNDKQSEFDLP